MTRSTPDPRHRLRHPPSRPGHRSAGMRVGSLILPLLLLLVLVPLEGIGADTATAPPFDAAAVFAKNCAVCHGKQGDGNTTVARSLNPPPTNFGSPEAVARLPREAMIQAIREGKKGSAMPGWQDRFNDSEIAALTDFIQNTFMLSTWDESAGLGRRIFGSNCSVCHGDKGDTAVWARSGLSPQPRDFTTDQAGRELTRERMLFSVTYGRPNTAMPAWDGRLKKEEIEAVVDYIRQAFMPRDVAAASPVPIPGTSATTPAPSPGATPSTPTTGQTSPGQTSTGQTDLGQTAATATPAPGGMQHDHMAHWDLAEIAKPFPLALQGDPVAGKQLYERTCYVCHGLNGDGKGPRADFIYPKPRNFHHPASLHKFSRNHLFFVISDGLPRSEMSSWKGVLQKQEIANVAEYVFQSFIVPGLPKGYVEVMPD
ncbi:MAG: c-type cytochrome, partial [Magnetococcales bacterium]|nr:c-type cytochrome [Magnetococcales bacterium]